MALYHKWDVKNGFAYVLQFFSLISDSLGSVKTHLLENGTYLINEVGTRWLSVWQIQNL